MLLLSLDFLILCILFLTAMDLLEFDSFPIVSIPETEENVQDMAAEFAKVQKFFDPEPELYYKKYVSIEDFLRDDFNLPIEQVADIDIEQLLAQPFDPTVLDNPEFQAILALLNAPEVPMSANAVVMFDKTKVKFTIDAQTGMIVAALTGLKKVTLENLSILDLLMILTYPFTQHGIAFRSKVPQRFNKKRYVLIPSKNPEAYELSSGMNIHWTRHEKTYEMRVVRHDAAYRMKDHVYLPASLRRKINMATLTNLICSLVPMQSVLFDLPDEAVASITECKDDETLATCNLLRILANYSMYNWKKLLSVL